MQVNTKGTCKSSNNGGAPIRMAQISLVLWDALTSVDENIGSLE